MNRLVHSHRGYLRQMQMSQARVWIFVEGKTDRYFYSKIADAVANECEKANSFRVVSADELAPDGGGKSVLMKFFEFLKSSGSLVSHFAGRQTRSVFCLDKDVDDLLRKRRVSPHLIYTEYYSIENYLFKFGNIVDACAVVLALPVQDVRRVLPSPRVWRQICVASWQDWVGICLFAAKLGIKSVNFGSASKINVGVYGPVDPSLLMALEKACLRAAGQVGNATQLLAECRQKVAQLYAASKHDRVFNGKWYAHFLEDHITRMLPTISTQGLAKRVVLHLAQSLNFNDQWARRLKLKLVPHLCLKAAMAPVAIPRQARAGDELTPAAARGDGHS